MRKQPFISKLGWRYHHIGIPTDTPRPNEKHLEAPACDMRLTLANAGLSLTKLPHMILFGIFSLLTAVQFTRVDRRTVAWSFVATLALGVLVELEEGATRTGNCRMTDVLPDLFGALIAMALLMAAMLIAMDARRGHLTQTLAPLTSDRVTTVVGFTELGADDHLYNAAAVFAHGAVVGLYRKLHPAIHRSVYRAGHERRPSSPVAH